jgi:hypothetical protein
VGFVVDKVAMGQVFSELLGFRCKSIFHQFFHNHHHLSSRAGSGRSTKSFTPLIIIKKINAARTHKGVLLSLYIFILYEVYFYINNNCNFLKL